MVAPLLVAFGSAEAIADLLVATLRGERRWDASAVGWGADTVTLAGHELVRPPDWEGRLPIAGAMAAASARLDALDEVLARLVGLGDRSRPDWKRVADDERYRDAVATASIDAKTLRRLAVRMLTGPDAELARACVASLGADAVSRAMAAGRAALGPAALEPDPATGGWWSRDHWLDDLVSPWARAAAVEAAATT